MTKAEQKKWLERIANGEEEIRTVEAGDPWLDDHMVCVVVRINGVDVELLWVGEDGYAAAKYAGSSQQAKADLLEVLKEQLENDMFDEDDEDD